MKRLKTAVTLLLCVAGISASTARPLSQLRYEQARGLALSTCIAEMNHAVDSLSPISRDYSLGYFVQLSELSLEEIVSIREYVREHCLDHWGTPQEPDGNMIGYSCWQFYRSKELDRFIRKTLKRKRRTEAL